MSKREGSDVLRVVQVLPLREPCGVGDYTRRLSAELSQLAHVETLTPGEFADRQTEFDIAHIQHQYFLYGGVAPWKNWFGRVISRVRIPAVMTVHELVEPEGNALRAAAIRTVNQRQFFDDRLFKLMVHTNADRERLLNWGSSPERVSVVRHGVPAVDELPNREAARTRLGVSESHVSVIFGFLARNKGHLAALEAFSRLPNNHHLVFAGGMHPDDTSDYAHEIDDAIKQAGLNDRVRVTGYLQEGEAAAWMSAADVVLAPFKSSSGSGSLAYALACGKPIIASDIAPHRELIGETAGCLQLIPVDQPEALAKAVKYWAENPGNAASAASNALKYAQEHRYGQMAEEIVGIYKSVLDGAV
jgi:glycosyltransferase involved in cell wall biosynthesis